MLSAFARLDAEADNLAAAMRWSLSSGQPEVVLRMGGALCWWLEMRLQHLGQYAKWLERALAQSDKGDPGDRARALGVIFCRTKFQPDPDKQAVVTEEALDLARRTGNPRLIGRAMWNRGHAAAGPGQSERARVLYQEALQIGRGHGDQMLVCDALEGLAFLERDLSKRYALLEELLAQAPYCYQFFPMLHLGQASYGLGAMERSEAWRRSALERGVELGTLFGQGDQLRELADIAFHRGGYDRAMALLERGVDLARQVGDLGIFENLYWLMGLVAWSRGDLVQATRYEEQVLNLSPQLGYGVMAALARLVLALVACEEGAYDRAEALCAEALDEPRLNDYGKSLAASTLARAALRRGDPARAVDLGREALGHMRRQHRRPDIVGAVGPLCWALAANGQSGEAAQLLACAARERDEMGMVLAPVDRPYYERAMDQVRGALDEEAFAAAWAAGEALSLDEAVAQALGQADHDE